MAYDSSIKFGNQTNGKLGVEIPADNLNDGEQLVERGDEDKDPKSYGPNCRVL